MTQDECPHEWWVSPGIGPTVCGDCGISAELYNYKFITLEEPGTVGWQCPVCGSVYAPFVRKCDYCPPVSSSGGTAIFYEEEEIEEECFHLSLEITTAGMYCKDCGRFISDGYNRM